MVLHICQIHLVQKQPDRKKMFQHILSVVPFLAHLPFIPIISVYSFTFKLLLICFFDEICLNDDVLFVVSQPPPPF